MQHFFAEIMYFFQNYDIYQLKWGPNVLQDTTSPISWVSSKGTDRFGWFNYWKNLILCCNANKFMDVPGKNQVNWNSNDHPDPDHPPDHPCPYRCPGILPPLWSRPSICQGTLDRPPHRHCHRLKPPLSQARSLWNRWRLRMPAPHHNWNHRINFR